MRGLNFEPQCQFQIDSMRRYGCEAKSRLLRRRTTYRFLMADRQLPVFLQDPPPHGICHGPIGLLAVRAFPPLCTRWGFSFLRHTFFEQTKLGSLRKETKSRRHYGNTKRINYCKR